jgi:ribose transport system permease protein/rhamnose transport system permease protein
VSAGVATVAPPRRRRFRLSQEILLALAIVALMVVVGLINPRYVATRNLQTILLGNAYIAIAAIGMSMVIMSGNIDISAGALIGVLATVSGSMAVGGWPLVLCWLAPLALGVLVMGVMGAMVAWLRIPSIVVTLGMLSILSGGLISVTGGAWITNLPPGYDIAHRWIADLVPMPVFLMIVLTIAAAFWLRNAEASRLVGISPQRTVVMVFAVHGLFVGVAAVMYATQLSVIQSTVPANLALTIITASVVGGVSILGGIGTVVGSTLAAVLIAAIGSSLIFVGISPYWLRAVQGLLILATVLADIVRRRRRGMSL